MTANPNLVRHAQLAPDEVPDGWRTVREIARDEKISRCWASQLLNRCVEQGTWERAVYRIRIGDFVRATPHFRPVSAQKGI